MTQTTEEPVPEEKPAVSDAKVVGRRRLAALGALVAVVVVAVVLIVALAGSGSEEPPATGAARVVPAGALAYLNVSLDRRRPSVGRILHLVSNLPGYALARAAVEGQLASSLGESGEFSQSAAPWLGNEAALAVLAGNGSSNRAGSLIVLSVRRRDAAQRFVASLPSSGSTTYRGVTLKQLPGGSEVALLGRFLLVGPGDDVDAAIDVARGGAASLAGSSAFRRASAGEPAGRVLDVYAPAVGLTRLLGGRSGLLGAFGALLNQPNLVAVSASLSPASGGLRAQVHSVFSPGTHPAPASAFSPSLMHVLPGGAAIALDLDGLSSASGLLSASGQLGVGGAIGPLLKRLGAALRAEGVDLSPVLSLFSGQTAVAVTSAGGHPALLIVARTAHPQAARVALANLEPPLASLFPAASRGPGEAPLFNSHQVGPITVHQLQLGPGLQLNYAVFNGLVAISTGVGALSALAHGGSLAGTPVYRSALGAAHGSYTSLVFLDLKELTRLGEQAGLLSGAGFSRLAPDVARIQAIGLRSRSGNADTTSELYFKIS